MTRKYDLNLRDYISFRPHTHDEALIRAILIDRSEYSLFVGCDPKIIFDIGANIGVTTVLFANTYPHAHIYAFEPEPENFAILQENIKNYPNVKAFQIALGAVTEQRTLMASDDATNFGGFSFHKKGVDQSKCQIAQVVDVADFLRNEGPLKIDLLKIDTEGCEFEILGRLATTGSLPPYIMGEAHGTNDWSMFQLLSITHDLKIDKELTSRVYPFYALRKHQDAAI